MEIEEQFVSYIVQRCLADCRPELKVLERDTDLPGAGRAALPAHPLRRGRASCSTLRPNKVNWCPATTSQCLPSNGVMTLAAPTKPISPPSSTGPSSSTTIPPRSKRSTWSQKSDRPEVCRSVDLLAPEGYGEITGGSERMSDASKLMAAIERHHLPMEPYEWYIDLRRYGSVVHSGFGLGVERTVAWVCGLDHVRETIAFPRMLTTMRP